MTDDLNLKDSCKIEAVTINDYRRKLPQIADTIIASCEDETCYTHIDYEPIPSKASVIDIIERFRQILFPGYFNRERIDPVNIRYALGQATAELFDKLGEQISHAIRHDCFRYNQPCSECEENGHLTALEILNAVPALRKILATDVSATYEGDPAAKSHDEIIFSYPGILAITIYRVAHLLHKLGIPLLPRIMTEYAHGITGIDIHPGADIGERFVIDHGTGVVIGETTVIGRNVRIYQGVTLGALSLPADAGERLRNQKRHPTIEDDVIIYSGATILGGDTIIGTRSIIGGNVWLTRSVAPDTSVILESPKLVYK
ncbi:MAG: serine acetyltransferase [Deltaproteobacteria bacterium]|nr:MAG: serine acetyltransferase [Deltaproteobacteria bacterium]